MNIKTPDLSTNNLLSSLPGFQSFYANVNGINIHYVRGGSGSPLILLPGWPQTWWAYHKIMPKLALLFDVIVVDIRGMGDSDKTAGKYDKKTLAGDIAALGKHLNLGAFSVGGHDVGAAVAFSLAINYTDQVLKLILIDFIHPEESMAQLPLIPAYGTFNGEALDPSSPYLWWWAFLQVKKLPEQLMEGRGQLLYDWFFENTLGNRDAISEFDRAVYYRHYAGRDAMAASNGWFQSFGQDITDQKTYAKLNQPVLGIGGGSFNWMSAVLPVKVEHLEMVHAANSGHFPAAEEPDLTAEAIITFLKKQ